MKLIVNHKDEQTLKLTKAILIAKVKTLNGWQTTYEVGLWDLTDTKLELNALGYTSNDCMNFAQYTMGTKLAKCKSSISNSTINYVLGKDFIMVELPEHYTKAKPMHIRPGLDNVEQMLCQISPDMQVIAEIPPMPGELWFHNYVFNKAEAICFTTNNCIVAYGIGPDAEIRFYEALGNLDIHYLITL